MGRFRLNLVYGYLSTSATKEHLHDMCTVTSIVNTEGAVFKPFQKKLKTLISRKRLEIERK
jgi:hypothetical protein